ncbi:MAG: GNAT family N-acetyltransferase [Candidatus Kariarchaeaceae archaeon]
MSHINVDLSHYTFKNSRMENKFTVENVHPIYTKWMIKFLQDNWGSNFIASRGKKHYYESLPGFVALKDHQIVGLITYEISDIECEIISLNSLREKEGIGTILIEKIKDYAKSQNLTRLWLITTNDNIKAQNFYERRGFSLHVVHKDSIIELRRLKPEIPKIGDNDIPIRDEYEYEIMFHTSNLL